jgi:hypothetical protein
MNAIEYTVLGYIAGLGLLLGYGMSLWLAGRRLGKGRR